MGVADILITNAVEVAWPNRRAVLAVLPEGGVGIELGVQQGGYSAELFRKTKPKRLFLVDIWQRQDPKKYPFSTNRRQEIQEKYYAAVLDRFREQIADGTVTVLRMWTDEALASLQDRELDWAYVDADHSYEPCLRDLRGCWHKVKRGGYILVHDFIPGYAGVVAAVSQFLDENHDVKCLGKTGDKYPTVVLRKGE